jgi:hypothetical protein
VIHLDEDAPGIIRALHGPEMLGYAIPRRGVWLVRRRNLPTVLVDDRETAKATLRGLGEPAP